MTGIDVAIAIATICYCMLLYAIVCYRMQIVCSRMLPYANRMQIIMLSYATICYRILLYPIVCTTEIAQLILHNTTDIAQQILHKNAVWGPRAGIIDLNGFN